jgi:hypothetical protein
MINNMIAKTFSLSTGKNGYGETASWPHPEEGRVALRTELHGHLLWVRANGSHRPAVVQMV